MYTRTKDFGFMDKSFFMYFSKYSFVFFEILMCRFKISICYCFLLYMYSYFNTVKYIYIHTYIIIVILRDELIYIYIYIFAYYLTVLYYSYTFLSFYFLKVSGFLKSIMSTRNISFLLCLHFRIFQRIF